MSEWTRQYEDRIAEFPPLSDSWFTDAIARAHQGDTAANNQISGSSLGIALAVASRFAQSSAVPLTELVEEANAVIPRAIQEFIGSESAVWAAHLETRIREALTTYLLRTS